MSLSRVGLGLAFAATCAACAARPFDAQFEAGLYEEAARTFQADTSLHREQRALMRAAIAHGLPVSSAFQPERARELLRRLLTLYPDGDHARDAAALLSLLDELARATRESRHLRNQVDSLRTRLSSLEAEYRSLLALLDRERHQADLLRTLAERLESDLRRTESELRMLREDLQKLKEVDLERLRARGMTPPPTVPESPPPDTSSSETAGRPGR